MSRKIVLLLVLTLMLHWSQTLQQFSIGPFQTPFEAHMKYLIGDVIVGDEVQIELTFPDGALSGVDPTSYIP